MPFRFNRRSTRLTVVAMLFVWLLVVGMGMANACLANEDHARHGHLQHQDAALAGHLTTAAQLDPHAQPTSSAKASCQTFCAAAQSSVFKQQSHEPGPADTGLALAISWWPAAPSLYRPSVWAVQRDSARFHPPIAIRFLRLTI